VVPDDDTVDELRVEVEALRRENEQLRTSKGGDLPPVPRRRGRWRRASAWVLIVLASLLAVVSVLVVFVRNEVLDTDTYVATVGPLASDPAIQSAVAAAVSRHLIEEVDVKQRVTNALPQKAGFLATPITSGLESLTHQVTLRVIQSAAFERLWISANRAAHKQVAALLTGDNSGVLTEDRGKVSVDLGNVQTRVKQALDKQGITIFDRVPTVNGPSFVLFQSDQLVKAQGLIRWLDRLSYLLPVLAVICYAGGIALNENRRRGLVRSAFGLVVAMGVLLVGVSIGRDEYLNALRPSVPRVAAANAYDAVTAFPLGTTRVVLLVALLIALVGIAVGNDRLRSWSHSVNKPGWLVDGPVHLWIRTYRRPLQWAVLAIGFVVIVVWDNPTPLVAIVIAAIVLAAVGLIGAMAGRRAVLLGIPGGPGGVSLSDPLTPGSTRSPEGDQAEGDQAEGDQVVGNRSDTAGDATGGNGAGSG
jgi:hypothetical protein